MEYHANGRWWCITACDMQLIFEGSGRSCSTTTAGSWFQSPTVLAANELQSPDEDAPNAPNINR